jgi:hypothetical protein
MPHVIAQQCWHFRRVPVMCSGSSLTIRSEIVNKLSAGFHVLPMIFSMRASIAPFEVIWASHYNSYSRQFFPASRPSNPRYTPPRLLQSSRQISPLMLLLDIIM